MKSSRKGNDAAARMQSYACSCLHKHRGRLTQMCIAAQFQGPHLRHRRRDHPSLANNPGLSPLQHWIFFWYPSVVSAMGDRHQGSYRFEQHDPSHIDMCFAFTRRSKKSMSSMRVAHTQAIQVPINIAARCSGTLLPSLQTY